MKLDLILMITQHMCYRLCGNLALYLAVVYNMMTLHVVSYEGSGTIQQKTYFAKSLGFYLVYQTSMIKPPRIMKNPRTLIGYRVREGLC